MTDQATTPQQAVTTELPTDPHFVDPFQRTGTRKYSAEEAAAKKKYEENQRRQAQALLNEIARLQGIADDYEQLRQQFLTVESAHDAACTHIGQVEECVADIPGMLKTVLQIILGPDTSITVQPVGSSKPLAVTCTVGGRTIEFGTTPDATKEAVLRTKDGVATFGVQPDAGGLSQPHARAAHQVYEDGNSVPEIYRGTDKRPVTSLGGMTLQNALESGRELPGPDMLNEEPHDSQPFWRR